MIHTSAQVSMGNARIFGNFSGIFSRSPAAVFGFVFLPSAQCLEPLRLGVLLFLFGLFLPPAGLSQLGVQLRVTDQNEAGIAAERFREPVVFLEAGNHPLAV